MRSRHQLWALLALMCCVGPDAPDDVLCRDLIHRVCLTPRCSSTSVLNIGEGCDLALQQRTGCDKDDFEFNTPSRARVLECRVGLVRSNTNTEAHPDCIDVDTMLNECTDVTHFLQGVPP